MKTDSNADIALLLIRAALGLVFIAHGFAKAMDMESTLHLFSVLHLSAFWAYLVTTVEIGGSILMFLGAFTGWVGIAFAVEMLLTMALVQLARGFIGGYELDLTLFLSALSISLAGPGRYTAAYLFRKREAKAA